MLTTGLRTDSSLQTYPRSTHGSDGQDLRDKDYLAVAILNTPDRERELFFFLNEFDLYLLADIKCSVCYPLSVQQMLQSGRKLWPRIWKVWLLLSFGSCRGLDPARLVPAISGRTVKIPRFFKIHFCQTQIALLQDLCFAPAPIASSEKSMVAVSPFSYRDPCRV